MQPCLRGVDASKCANAQVVLTVVLLAHCTGSELAQRSSSGTLQLTVCCILVQYFYCTLCPDWCFMCMQISHPHRQRLFWRGKHTLQTISSPTAHFDVQRLISCTALPCWERPFITTYTIVMQDLRRANFTAADIRNSQFKGANLQGAYLIKAVAFRVRRTPNLQRRPRCASHHGQCLPQHTEISSVPCRQTLRMQIWLTC